MSGSINSFGRALPIATVPPENTDGIAVIYLDPATGAQTPRFVPFSLLWTSPGFLESIGGGFETITFGDGSQMTFGDGAPMTFGTAGSGGTTGPGPNDILFGDGFPMTFGDGSQITFGS